MHMRLVFFFGYTDINIYIDIFIYIHMRFNIDLFFGLFAGTCTSISFVPQILTIYKAKNTDAISLKMLLIHFSGVSAWIVYGVLKEDEIMVAFNSLTFCCLCTILGRCAYLNRKLPLPVSIG